MYRIHFILVVLVILFCGCKKQDGIVLFHSFPNNTWGRFEKQHFELAVNDINRPYDVYLILRHDDTYPFDHLFTHVIIYMPDGEERIAEYDFEVKGAGGEFLSEKLPEYYEISYILKKGLRFGQPGICTIEMENLIPKMEITGIMALGIRLEKSREK